MSRPILHEAAERGDLAAVRAAIETAPDHVNTLAEGYSPLMLAAANRDASPEVLKVLLSAGADPDQFCEHFNHADQPPLAIALHAGALDKVECLVEAGANIRYRRSHNFNALLDAVHGHDIRRDPDLLRTLGRLIDWGVDLNAVSSYAESGLRVLSHMARFDAVRLLLLAGADASQLEWTPLMRAVAIGTVEDVKAELAAKPDLEAVDWWSRTAFLIAVLTGEQEKLDLLWAAGANVQAVGRCSVPALSLALEAGRLDVAKHLIRLGVPVDGRDEFGATPLMYAIESGNEVAVDLMICSGADVDAVKYDFGLMHEATDRAVILRLLKAGADPADLSRQGMRAVLGFDSEPRPQDLTATPAEFAAGKARRFGKSNPELMNDPFWLAMIRSGVDAYNASMKYKGRSSVSKSPVWCASRFGQSWTLLKDGRIILVAGEHEDWYDPDFCIYNDVWIRYPDGHFDIYGYPEDVFPPTDFHTATLVGSRLWLIGSLSYRERRQYGTTQVFVLDLQDMKMRRVETSGESPGWINRHRANLIDDAVIEISGGNVCERSGTEETYEPLKGAYRLDLWTNVWSRVE
jgi:ankyrin repeat protein